MRDHELLEAWVAGDTDAAQTLVSRYIDVVHRFFVGKVEEDLEDLVQRTFLKCVEKNASYRGEGSFRAFLLGIARYELLDTYRVRNSGRVFDPAVTSLEDLADRPSELLVLHEQKQVLLAALRRIPVEQQLLLELRYWETLNSTEIGEVFEIPAPTVRDRLRKARAALEAAMLDVAASPDVAQSTLSSFDRWAASLRAESEI